MKEEHVCIWCQLDGVDAKVFDLNGYVTSAMHDKAWHLAS